MTTAAPLRSAPPPQPSDVALMDMSRADTRPLRRRPLLPVDGRPQSRRDLTNVLDDSDDDGDMYTSAGDVHDAVPPSAPPPLDLITVSSPCTPFSLAGYRDPNDVRIQLTFKSLELACDLRPRVIMFENVPYVKVHDRVDKDDEIGRTWRRCLKIFADAGYSVCYRDDVDAQSFVPQRRTRFIAIAALGTLPDLDAAVDARNAMPPVTLRQRFPHWKGVYFHQSRGSRRKCLFTLDGVSPPLRTNCGTLPHTYVHTPGNGDVGRFEDRVTPTLRELAAIAGWPEDAHLPKYRTKAGVILGNCVCPPVAAWLGGLIADTLRPRHGGTRQLRAMDFFCGGGGSSLGLEKAGFDIVVGVDYGQSALEIFAANHPRALALQGDFHHPEQLRPVLVRFGTGVAGADDRAAAPPLAELEDPDGDDSDADAPSADEVELNRPPPRPPPSPDEILRQSDLAAPGAVTAPLPGTDDPQALAMDAAVPDPDVNRGAVHAAQLRRRERRRLTEHLRLRIASDGTLRDVSDPIWSAPPLGAPPSSGNPAMMFGARPWLREDADHLPTHHCSVSQCWRHWGALHMFHCKRCQRHSALNHGRPPPLAQLGAAHAGGPLPPADEYTLDPECYSRGMLADIRTGFAPPFAPDPIPMVKRNGPSCWNEWDAQVQYMEKLDRVGCLEPGLWTPPADSIVSAMHCVIRPSDLREWKATGAAYPVRTVLDLTGSGLNACMPDWRFRIQGIDSAVHMLGAMKSPKIGTTDISKFFPTLPLARTHWNKVMLNDPRCASRWGGKGAPTAEWRDFQAARHGRTPPYRPHSGLPLGFKLAPAFACALSGEIVQFLAAHGVRAVMYVDDCLLIADSVEECKAAMDLALSIFRWLGLKCNDDKQQGPASVLTFIGYEIDCVNREVRISDDRRKELLAIAARLSSARSCNTHALETDVGKLGFAAGVMRGGRAFLHHLQAALTTALRAGSDVVTLGRQARVDASWWRNQLTSMPQCSRIWLADEVLPVVTLKSDASGELGGGWGYVYDSTLHWSTWLPSTVTDTHIAFKELCAVVHAAEEYGPRFRDRLVRFGVDNTSVVYAVNKMSSSCALVTDLLRRLATAMCAHNFDCVAVWVSRRYNDIADMTTRFQALSEFEAHLPRELTVGRHPFVCRRSSPADNEPVFGVRLRARSAPASSPPLAGTTTAASASSSTSATPTAGSPTTPTSTPSRASSSSTSPASAPRSSAPTRPSSSSSPRGVTTLSSPTCPSRTQAPRFALASCASSTASPGSTLTPRSGRHPSASALSGASRPGSASAPSPTSAPPRRASSPSGRASSPRTAAASARSSTRRASASRTSAASPATSPCSSAAARASASTTAPPASASSPSPAPSSAPGTSCGTSSNAAGAAPLPATSSSPTSSATSPSTTASPGRRLSAASAAWRPRSASRSPVATACAPEAPPTSSPSKRRGGGSSDRAAGSATPSTSTTAPRTSGVLTWPRCSPPTSSTPPPTSPSPGADALHGGEN